MSYKSEQFLRRMVLSIFSSPFFSFPAIYRTRIFVYRKIFHIGTNPIIESGVWLLRTHGIPGTFKAGRHVLLASNVFIDYTGNVELEDNVWISEGAEIHSHSHSTCSERISRKRATIIPQQVLLRKNCWIGAKSIILPQAKEIGENSIVGAGSVVTKPVPANVIVAGNPARILKRLPV